jgi:8-oxo-dGTP diphosphatase
MTQYYIETDGKIYLIEEEGKLKFPVSKEEVPFPVEPKGKMVIGTEEVIFSEPELSDHPSKWVNKEDVPLLSDVDPTVRKAVDLSLPRIVVEAVIREEEEGKVLMVKPSRGYNRDSWTLPGGFLVYGEPPAQALEREVKEEIGVEPEIGDLVNVFSSVGASNSHQWVVFYYFASISNEMDTLKPSHEIKELGWFPPEKVVDVLNSPIMSRGYEEIITQGKLV